jgi:hypothetical protein
MASKDDKDCADYGPSEIKLSRTEAGVLGDDIIERDGDILIADFGVDWRHVKERTAKDAALKRWIKRFEEDDTYQLEILGYTDCGGNERNNYLLRKGRADFVYKLLSPSARKRVRTCHPAPEGTYVAENTTAEGRARNRSVVIRFEKNLNMEAEREQLAVGPVPCEDVAKEKKTFHEYVRLLQCLEAQFPQYTPRQMLSLIRQRYYGTEKWSCTRDKNWQDVIPCGLKLDDPWSARTRPLLEGLCKRDNKGQIVEGVDIGHVLTGLEAMICPQDKITFHVPVVGELPTDVVNEEFATWVGDLASAVAQKVFDEIETNTKRGWDAYFLKPNTLAPESDLLGDVDSYAMRHGLTGVDCENSRMLPIKRLDRRVSQIIAEYYVGMDGPLKGLIRRRFSCFCKAIGISVSANNEISTDRVKSLISPRISRAAERFFQKIEKNKRKLPGNYGVAILIASDELSELFAMWLAAGLRNERE